MTTEELRFLWLKKLYAGRTQKKFAEDCGLNPSYLSQVLTGVRGFREKGAKNMEARLGLVPGTLVHPKDAALIESTPLESLYLPPDELAKPLVANAIKIRDKGAKLTETDLQRIAILRAIIGNQKQIDFCAFYEIDPAYLSQILNGFRAMGDKSIQTYESKFNLLPGVLEHPMDIEFATQGDIEKLFKNPQSMMPNIESKESTKVLIKKLSDMMRSGELQEHHLKILDQMATAFVAQNMAEKATL
jgi:transcriptional regulator with XRE-family HTH domain